MGPIIRMLFAISTGNGCSHAKVTISVEQGGVRANLIYHGSLLGIGRQRGLACSLLCFGSFTGVRPADKDRPM